MQLDRLQHNFLDHVVRGNSRQWDDLITSDGRISTQTRLEIYQNNILTNLTEVLKTTYPAIWSLLGEQFSTGIAREYIRQHLPQTGLVDDWGESFPYFIKQHKAGKDVPYIQDIGHIEWLLHQAYCAEDKTPLCPTQLQTFTEADIPELTFTFHPSFGLFKSTYPLDQIFGLAEGEHTQDVDPDSGRSYCLVIRQEMPAKFWVDEHLYQFFDCLSKGRTLSQTFDRIKNPTFDFQNSLTFLLSNGFVTGVHKREDNEGLSTKRA